MTYLNGPRLHFAGRFRAEVSTVNNFVTHFDDPDDPPEPGWNPGGSGGWRLVDCAVTRAVYRDGGIAQAAAEDAVIGLLLSQIDSAVLVDLDPEQQLASQIWGLQLRLGGPGIQTAFRGTFKTAAFSDLWFARALVPGRGDFKMTAFFHSVLTGVAWGDPGGSRLLAELQADSDAGLLSIKINVDGFDQRVHVGRIVGTIGPAGADEPAHFVRGRHCMPRVASGPVWFFPSVVDTERGKLVADFGNALHTTSVGGPFDTSVDLEIGTLAVDGFSSLGTVPIGGSGWYEQTAGVCEFPADRALTTEELTDLGSRPIAVRRRDGDDASVVASEGADGQHVRADDFVYRVSANETVSVTLHATQFGQPLPTTTLDVRTDLSGLQQGSNDHAVGEPPDGIVFPASVTTDADGVARLSIRAASIDQPRDYIDGQVYGIRATVADSEPDDGGYANPNDFISVLVWTDYRPPAEPAWNQDVAPILSEYAQLYPVMAGIVDLADYDSVVDNRDQMAVVFNLPQENPHYMPVTRDLSPAKRQMILAWLQTTGNAGRPNLDRAAGVAAIAAAAADPGGKSAALGRLLRERG